MIISVKLTKIGIKFPVAMLMMMTAPEGMEHRALDIDVCMDRLVWPNFM
jgi:hypothetical protein